MNIRLLSLVTLAVFLLSSCSNPLFSTKLQNSVTNHQKPNIVIVVTDDQGIGDIGLNQNPIIHTPHLDELAKQSVSFTNFHVDPTCSPTRSALLTGKHSLNAGVWHTILGRYMLGPEHKTLAEELQQAGYDTALFGKWHLGDNYPYRPQDQGFDETFIHGGGGVGQTPDYWGNTQFDDTYYRNGEPEKTKGYATTIWFDAAKQFISKKRDNPYFTMLALNAPHGPYRAPEEFIAPYIEKGLDRTMASFYGMITHIDGQVAQLRQHIEDSGDLDNTIFIFMTDNGSSYRPTNNQLKLSKQHEKLATKYPDWRPNTGLNGYKGSVFEGGHRVPFYISYPNGNLSAKTIDTLAAHYDVLPTLLELAGLAKSEENLDGSSLVTLIMNNQDQHLEDRAVVITNQRVYHPDPTRPTVVAKGDWRYIEEYGKSMLFNLKNDLGQQINVKDTYPDVVKSLISEKQKWWENAKQLGFKDRFIGVGYSQEDPVRLNAMDWMEVPKGQPVPWFIGHQSPAEEYDYVHWLTEEDKYQPLPWYINVAENASYTIKPYYHDIPANTPVLKKYCVIDKNGEQIVQRVWGRASHCVVNTRLTAGKQKISAWFTDDPSGKDKQKAAFYLYLDKLDGNK